MIRITETVSTSWLTSVEPLLRNQRWRPSVRRFQKWKIWTSMNWAARYAIIEAVTALKARRRTSKKTPD